MAALDNAVARAAAGEFRVVMLSGEGGFGKGSWHGNCSPATRRRLRHVARARPLGVTAAFMGSAIDPLLQGQSEPGGDRRLRRALRRPV